MKYLLPSMNWAQALSDMLKGLPDGSEIVVDSPAKKEIAELAIARMGRKGITVSVEVPDGTL